MGQVWYGIAATAEHNYEVFWEINLWDKTEASALSTGASKRKGKNHTLTIDVPKPGQTEGTRGDTTRLDYWDVATKPGEFSLSPRMKLCCCYVAPMTMAPHFISFPKDGGDPTEEFWAYHFKGGPCGSLELCFMFATTPHVKQSAYDAALEKFEKENGIPKSLWNKVKWNPEYKMGN